MNPTRSAFQAVVFLGAATLLAAGASVPPLLRQAEDEEPPERFELLVDGKRLEVELDVPFEIEVGQKRQRALLSVQPTRLLRIAELELAYPRGMDFEAELSGEVDLWTLDGGSAVLMLQRYPGQGGGLGPLKNTFLGYLEEALGEAVSRKATTIALDGREVDGTELVFAVGGIPLLQEVFVFACGEVGFVMVVQDSLDDDDQPTAEARGVRALLEETLRFH